MNLPRSGQNRNRSCPGALLEPRGGKGEPTNRINVIVATWWRQIEIAVRLNGPPLCQRVISVSVEPFRPGWLKDWEPSNFPDVHFGYGNLNIPVLSRTRSDDDREEDIDCTADVLPLHVRKALRVRRYFHYMVAVEALDTDERERYRDHHTVSLL